MELWRCRQPFDIYAYGRSCAGGTRYPEDVAFDPASMDRDIARPTVNGAVGDTDRQNDIKGRAGVRFGLELARTGAFQRHRNGQGGTGIAHQIELFQGFQPGKYALWQGAELVVRQK